MKSFLQFLGEMHVMAPDRYIKVAGEKRDDALKVFDNIYKDKSKEERLAAEKIALRRSRGLDWAFDRKKRKEASTYKKKWF